ncbi:MAG: oxidoreductase [Spirochaetae bacterium HGW-Spirochaetae-1]|nr:MAG: oxidoreductase [Spirochaetae bacterium HGW-Spirochaetae-1]
MDKETFKAMIVREKSDGTFEREIGRVTTDDLPPGDVLVRVDYSSLNYKDALSCTGNRGVTRKYPHTPGIDAAGIVTESGNESFKPGDKVVVTSYDLGMNTWGGFSQYIRVPAGWVVPLPGGLTLRESMVYGTAGFTAGLSVYRLIEHGKIRPGDGTVLVTGAMGGVGSHAVAILSRAGYHVTAVTGIMNDPGKEFDPDQEYLKKLGAAEVLPREKVDDTTGKAMLRPQWAGVIDTVGGNVLSTAVKQTAYGGAVTSCGNAGGQDLSLTVFPFILRGVALLGIDSADCPREHRVAIWKRLAAEWKDAGLDSRASDCSLEELSGFVDIILQGKLKGRKVVNLSL